MQVVLFRPHQRHRKGWIERLQHSGYAVKFVHDPERVPEGTDVVVIDTAVGRWKDYVRLVKDCGIPVVLLADHDAVFADDELESLGSAGIVKQEQETDQLFAPFMRSPKADETSGTLSQRKAARQEERLGRASGEIPLAIQGNIGMEPCASGEQPHVQTKEPLSKRASATRTTAQPPWPSRAAGSRELPSVAAVYAAKGGVGKTTFLLDLATLLSKAGRKVCVLDLDVMHGAVAAMLHMEPHKTIVDLVRRIDDPKASRACLLQTKHGFTIVAAPLQPGTFRMQREQLLAIVRFLKEETDAVLIDTPAYVDSVVKLALEQAEQLYLMTTDEAASMAGLARMSPFIGSLRPTPEVYLVWNRLLGPTPEAEWRDRLPWPTRLALPEDVTVGKRARSGSWIASSPCSPYAVLVKQFADRWLGIEPERPTNRRSLLRKFLAHYTWRGTSDGKQKGDDSNE